MEKQSKLTHSARRINFIADKFSAAEYLEIGVHKGSTFLGVNIPHKIAVDPKFRFNFQPLNSSSVEFFEVTSDSYFTDYAGARKFDIIFLDGLHTFEQTFRDFCSSLMHCHDRTVWFIDDTVPIDAYSSLKDQRKAIQYRKETGNDSGAWHGDVFKIVFAIHDFFPSLSYCTINTRGNPQTILWRRPRRDFKPVFNDLEVISRLGYFDLLDNREIYNFQNEEDGLSLVAF